MHDDRVHACVAEEHDVLGERLLQACRRSSRCRRTSPRWSCRGTPSATAAPRPTCRPWRSPSSSPGAPSRRVPCSGSSSISSSRRSSRARRRASGRWSTWWPRSPPDFRSMVTVTSRGSMSTRAGSSSGVDRRQTQTPLIATSRSAGSNAAVVVPIEARTRPQFGSLPNTAVLKSELRATDRPTSTASSSLAAPVTVIAISWSAPSASASSCIARSRAQLRHRLGEVRLVGRDAGGAAAQQRHGVVRGHAAVGVQPVEADPGGLAQRAVGGGRVDLRVGGEDHEHGGQLRREHAGALGHAADRSSRHARRRLLAHRVGGHDRRGGVGAAVGVERRDHVVDALEEHVTVVGEPDQAGRADHDVEAPTPRPLATRSATSCVVWKPSAPV